MKKTFQREDQQGGNCKDTLIYLLPLSPLSLSFFLTPVLCCFYKLPNRPGEMTFPSNSRILEVNRCGFTTVLRTLQRTW